MSTATISRREADIFACLADTVVAPRPPMPAVHETDAVDYFDRMLAAAPALNRAGLRAALLALELAPRLAGRRARLRRLPAPERVAFLHGLDRPPQLRSLVYALTALAQLSYYGDDGVMRSLGYDPEANLARARELRARERRW